MTRVNNSCGTPLTEWSVLSPELSPKHKDQYLLVKGYADPYALEGEEGREKEDFHTPCAKKFKTPGSSHPFSLDVPHFWPILKHYKTQAITIPT